MDFPYKEQLSITPVTDIGSGFGPWVGGVASGLTTGISSIMGKTWSERIIFDAQPDRVLSKYFIEFTDLIGNNDLTFVIPKIGDVNLMGGRVAYGEGTTRTLTNFDTADNVTVYLTSRDVKLGGCGISFETASGTRVSLVEMAHRMLVQQYLETLETDANACLEKSANWSAVGSTGPSAVYGGDATDSDELNTGDVITVDKIVDMKIKLQEKNFAKRPGQAVLFVHPTQYKFLLKSSQFTSAEQYGSGGIVQSGVIENYVGCKIEVSTLLSTSATFTTNTSCDAWGATGHIAYMIDPSAAACIVWKEKAKVKVETWDDERVHKVLLDAWYKMSMINYMALCYGLFTDS